MTIRKANAEWKGSLKEGAGHLRLGSGLFEGRYSFPSRFEHAPGTNPELIAAAHAGCFSMALSFFLEQTGYPPTWIRTNATVHIGMTAAGPTLTRIELSTEAAVDGITEKAFDKCAENAKAGCLVSRALAGVGTITLESRLVHAAPGTVA
jgi:osmotically inducible protein OsmC